MTDYDRNAKSAPQIGKQLAIFQENWPRIKQHIEFFNLQSTGAISAPYPADWESDHQEWLKMTADEKADPDIYRRRRMGEINNLVTPETREAEKAKADGTYNPINRGGSGWSLSTGAWIGIGVIVIGGAGLYYLNKKKNEVQSMVPSGAGGGSLPVASLAEEAKRILGNRG